MLAEYEFRIRLNAEERLEIELVRQTLLDVLSLLRDIERQLTNGQPAAKWGWAGDVDLSLVASVNGVSAGTLERVVEKAAEGFEAASEAAAHREQVIWPEEFGQEARQRASRILKRLRRLDSITIESTGTPAVEIRSAAYETGGRVTARMPGRRSFSAVEGVLRMISGGDRTIRAGLREQGTNTHVSVQLDRERWHEEVRRWWDKRVVIEGRVSYSPDGRPLSVVDVTEIRERVSDRPLLAFIGAAPGLGGDLTDEQLIEALRPDA